jgi:hypothetical protein
VYTLESVTTLCFEFLGVTVIVCWADARVYPLANPERVWVAQGSRTDNLTLGHLLTDARRSG